MTWSAVMFGGWIDICESSKTSITQPAKPCQTSFACHLLFAPLPAAPFEALKAFGFHSKRIFVPCLWKRQALYCSVHNKICVSV